MPHTVIPSPNEAKAAIDSACEAERSIWSSIRHGWSQRCPCCNQGALYKSYLKVADQCGVCGTELHHQRADDAPPYFVMTITGHIVIGGIFFVERNYTVNPWLQFAIWIPVLLLLTLWMLPRVKGALIGYQWALRMHGFGSTAYEGADLAPVEPERAT